MRRFTLEIPTNGETDIINLSPQLAPLVRESGADEGVLHLFVVGSTAALTTVEYEPGLVKHDIPALFDRLIPSDARYDHEATWNDDNGHSHLRASLLGPSLTVPFAKGKLLTGEYQQVVLIEFDTRPRRRTVIGTVLA
jgi:secondary thiamine-phosphate synthase enzyme